MSVDNSQAKEPVRTYKDDIIYQTVKGSHKRTPFVSCDQQIVNMGANTINNIEKSEKLLTSHMRRSQTALLANLDRLQKVQESISCGTGSNPDRRLLQRRLSTPFDSFHLPPSPTRNVKKRGSAGSEDDVDGAEYSQAPNDIPSSLREMTAMGETDQDDSICAPTPNIKEARRLSFVAQEETSREALKKVNAMVAEHKRRATIAAGATDPLGLLPSASDLERLNEIAKRSMCIEEEHYPCTSSYSK